MLSDIYFAIQSYNYEAKRVRDAVEKEILDPQYYTKSETIIYKQNLSIKDREQILRSPQLRSNLDLIRLLLLDELKKLEELLSSSELTSNPGYNDPIYNEIKNNQ